MLLFTKLKINTKNLMVNYYIFSINKQLTINSALGKEVNYIKRFQGAVFFDITGHCQQVYRNQYFLHMTHHADIFVSFNHKGIKLSQSCSLKGETVEKFTMPEVYVQEGDRGVL